ncbi:MAG: hypothetical protein Q8P49_01730, partial [Candidatus Liptonbacteria bacterium]|nr:hypothetical protein [Candidatus Liptonbacteria bacterium]
MTYSPGSATLHPGFLLGRMHLTTGVVRSFSCACNRPPLRSGIESSPGSGVGYVDSIPRAQRPSPGVSSNRKSALRPKSLGAFGS